MTYKEAKEMIMDMYPGRLFIGKKELCQLLATSMPTLDRRLASGDKLGQIAQKERRRVLFSVPDLARILADEQ